MTTIRTSTLLVFLVALIAGAWPLALPTAQSNAQGRVSQAAQVESPSA